MKYLRKYNESKIVTLGSLSDDELKERLKWLRIEQEEVNKEIGDINRLLISRREDIESKYSESLPGSIFDFNKEQLEWIFQHGHGTTQKHYEIAQKYIRELHGVHQTGFNQNTNQFYFTIGSSYCFNDAEDGFELRPDIVKSIKFLGENLKRYDGGVEFGISYYYDDHSYNDKAKYISESEIYYTSGYGRATKKDSIEKLLEDIVDNDLFEKDNSEY